MTSTTNRVIDPNHGNTFVGDLQNTVGQNDFLTLGRGLRRHPDHRRTTALRHRRRCRTHHHVPDTGGWQTWQTVDAGTFQSGTYHTVQSQYLNVNWWAPTNVAG